MSVCVSAVSRSASGDGDGKSRTLRKNSAITPSGTSAAAVDAPPQRGAPCGSEASGQGTPPRPPPPSERGNSDKHVLPPTTSKNYRSGSAFGNTTELENSLGEGADVGCPPLRRANLDNLDTSASSGVGLVRMTCPTVPLVTPRGAAGCGETRAGPPPTYYNRRGPEGHQPSTVPRNPRSPTAPGEMSSGGGAKHGAQKGTRRTDPSTSPHVDPPRAGTDGIVGKLGGASLLLLAAGRHAPTRHLLPRPSAQSRAYLVLWALVLLFGACRADPFVGTLNNAEFKLATWGKLTSPSTPPVLPSLPVAAATNTSLHVGALRWLSCAFANTPRALWRMPSICVPEMWTWIAWVRWRRRVQRDIEPFALSISRERRCISAWCLHTLCRHCLRRPPPLPLPPRDLSAAKLSATARTYCIV